MESKSEATKNFNSHKNLFFFFFDQQVICIFKRGAKEATQIATVKNNSPPYKRTQATMKAQKTLSLNAYTPIL